MVALESCCSGPLSGCCWQCPRPEASDGTVSSSCTPPPQPPGCRQWGTLAFLSEQPLSFLPGSGSEPLCPLPKVTVAPGRGDGASGVQPSQNNL